jgi:hypothetical protein
MLININSNCVDIQPLIPIGLASGHMTTIFRKPTERPDSRLKDTSEGIRKLVTYMLLCICAEILHAFLFIKVVYTKTPRVLLSPCQTLST